MKKLTCVCAAILALGACSDLKPATKKDLDKTVSQQLDKHTVNYPVRNQDSFEWDTEQVQDYVNDLQSRKYIELNTEDSGLPKWSYTGPYLSSWEAQEMREVKNCEDRYSYSQKSREQCAAIHYLPQAVEEIQNYLDLYSQPFQLASYEQYPKPTPASENSLSSQSTTTTPTKTYQMTISARSDVIYSVDAEHLADLRAILAAIDIYGWHVSSDEE